MEKRNKYSFFNLDTFQKVEDLIFLDEPILTHLKKGGKDYLLYLVDTEKDVDVFLLFEVSEDSIYQYLVKKTTLKSIILDNNNFVFILDFTFDGKLKYVNFLSTSKALPKGYLPSEDSYIDFEPDEDSYYFDLITKYNDLSYLKKLRENAFYVKLSPTNSKYATTIGFNELVDNLLKNLSKSYKNFTRADFFEEFKEKETDRKKLEAAYRRISQELDYRMVDLKYGSFEIGLSIDKVMKKSIEDADFQEWSVKVGDKYKDLVLENAFIDEYVDYITNTYSIEDRNKIFNPFFSITQNPNYKFQIKDFETKKYKTVKTKDKYKIELISPKKITPLQETEIEIIQLTTVKNKNQKTVKISENSLFETTNKKIHHLKQKDFKKYGYDVDQNIDIEIEITIDNGKIVLNTSYNNEYFQSIVKNDKFEQGVKNLIDKIYEYLVNN